MAVPTPPPSPAAPPTVGQTLAFRCGARSFSFGEILRAGAAAGRPLELALPEGGPDLEAALEAFRYGRDLVSAEECEAWLAARGLSYEDLVESFTRRLAEDSDSPPPGWGEADLVLSEGFPHFARRFARKVALVVEQGRSLPSDLTQLVAVLDAAERDTRAAQTSAADRRKRLGALRLALSRVVVESAEFDEAGPAREACHCINVDHASFAEVSLLSGCARETFRGFFSDLPGPWAAILLGREIGQATILALEDGRHLVLGLRRRELPSLADDKVCRRLDDQAMEEHCAEVELRHVQWLIAL